VRLYAILVPSHLCFLQNTARTYQLNPKHTKTTYVDRRLHRCIVWDLLFLFQLLRNSFSSVSRLAVGVNWILDCVRIP